MFGFRRIPLGRRTRLKAVRGLYIRSNDENNPQARGLRLLRTWLSPPQLEQFNAKGHFDVIGCATGRRYRIHYGTSMNVHQLDEAGRPRIGWCFVPQGCLVAGDVMLAQKLALETSEMRALSVANNFALNDWAGIIPRRVSHGPRRGLGQQASRRDRSEAVEFAITLGAVSVVLAAVLIFSL
jgi:hypothetical protein